MAYFNQGQSDSLGPGLAAYQVMEQLELQSARRVTVMDQILQARSGFQSIQAGHGLWGQTRGVGAQYVGRS